MMIIRGVNVFPTQIEELILKQPALAPHYYCEITRPQHLDNLTVYVEMQPGEERSDAGAHQLEHHIKSYIGVTATVKLVAPGGVERSMGKARRIVDSRPK